MTARGRRGVWAFAVLLAASALAASPAFGVTGGADAKAKPQRLNAASPGPVRSGTGIVQAVRAHAVVVRQLDGQRIVVAVGPKTVVQVNGVRSGLAAIRPGFVVTFNVRPNGAAAALRASDPSGRVAGAAKPGTVESVSADAVVVTGKNGSVTVLVGPRTHVLLNETPVTIAEIAAGDQLVKASGDKHGTRPARVLRFRR